MARSEKDLTEKEKKRLEKTNEIIKELEDKKYKKVDLTVSVVKANVYAIITSLPFILIFLGLFFIINGKPVIGESSFVTFIVFWVAYFVSIVVHELIHGITFSIFAKNHWKDIDFGVVWSMLTPYCTCICPIKKSGYLLALLMPGIVLGIIPSIVALFIPSVFLLLFGLLMIVGAGGDLLICFMIIKHKSKKKEMLFLDHPTEVGVLLFEK